MEIAWKSWQKYGESILLLLCAAGLVHLLDEWSDRAAAILKGSIDSDVLLYFTVGRGILNGLIPYIDLYESKPPGIFFLSMLSLMGAGGTIVWRSLAIAILAGIPLMVVGCSKTLRKEMGKSRALLHLLIVANIALLCALYIEERSAGAEIGSFGCALATAFAAVSLHPGKNTRANMIILSMLMLASLSLQEPFFLVEMLVGMLIARSLYHVILFVVIPALAAGVAWIGVLWVTGLFWPYIDIYLPLMLFAKADVSSMVPAWMIGFDVKPLVNNMGVYYAAAPLLIMLLAFLWGWMPIRNERKEDVWATLLASWLGFALVMCGGFAIFTMTMRWRSSGSIAIDRLLGWYLIEGGGITAVLWVLWKSMNIPWKRMVIQIAVLYAISSIVAMTGYVGNHFVLAVPIMLTAAMITMEHAWKTAKSIQGVIVLMTLLVTFQFRTTLSYAQYLTLTQQNSTQERQNLAKKLDQILDACGIEQYGADDTTMFALAKHSPWGPLFTSTHPYLSKRNEGQLLLYQTERNLLEKNQAYVSQDVPAHPLWPKMAQHFSDDAPTCAQPFLPLGKYTVWFRRED